MLRRTESGAVISVAREAVAEAFQDQGLPELQSVFKASLET